MWNQHSYHITNVNDDGTIPAHEQPNWTSYNNYRQNVQGAAGMPVPQGDGTGKIVVGVDHGDCVTVEKLYALICNRGTAPFGAMMPGTFYRQDPRKGGMTNICTARTTMPLQPGKCEQVECDWKNPPMGGQDLWFRANDDGTTSHILPECKGGNDLAFLPGVDCMGTPG